MRRMEDSKPPYVLNVFMSHNAKEFVNEIVGGSIPKEFIPRLLSWYKVALPTAPKPTTTTSKLDLFIKSYYYKK